MVGLTRLELVTPRLSSACSNQLSYRPFTLVDGFELMVDGEDFLQSTINYQLSTLLVEAQGLEPWTSSLQSWRSTN
jgi:hypothetical protein